MHPCEPARGRRLGARSAWLDNPNAEIAKSQGPVHGNVSSALEFELHRLSRQWDTGQICNKN
ncbi:hypothetical protein K438DRAFT_1846170 [Mycena galopus ATCC 62051]|nr:hypothetical protein K438DRAFT_1846170 [Mycena galopus ATCC 62051]